MTGRVAMGVLIAGLLWISGCDKAPESALPRENELVTVRLEVIERNHPLWNRSRSTRLSEPSKAVAQGTVRDGSFPELMVASNDIPTRRVLSGGARESASVQPAIERMESLREVLKQDNLQVLARERQVLSRAMDARIVARNNELSDLRKREENRLDQVYKMRFIDIDLQMIAYKSQMAVSNGDVRIQAGKSYDLLKRRRQEEANDLDGQKKALAKSYDRLLSVDIEAGKREIEAKLQQRATALSQETDSTIASYLSEIERRKQDLVPISLPPLPEAKPVEEIVLKTPRAAVAEAAAKSTSPAAPDVARAERAQQQRLVSYIRTDTKRRVERLAVVNRWKVKFVEEPGPLDRTDVVLKLLSSEWNPKASGE